MKSSQSNGHTPKIRQSCRFMIRCFVVFKNYSGLNQPDIQCLLVQRLTISVTRESIVVGMFLAFSKTKTKGCESHQKLVLSAPAVHCFQPGQQQNMKTNFPYFDQRGGIMRKPHRARTAVKRGCITMQNHIFLLLKRFFKRKHLDKSSEANSLRTTSADERGVFRSLYTDTYDRHACLKNHVIVTEASANNNEKPLLLLK